MQQKTKCLIGSIILAPFVLAAIIGIGVGALYIIATHSIIGVYIAIFLAIIISLIFTAGELYESCMKRKGGLR